MGYLEFEAARRPLCDQFEADLARAEASPRSLGYDELEAMAQAYRQILHHQASASRRFPGTNMARRLARLAHDGTHWLQRDTGSTRRGLAWFFRRALPEAVAHTLPLMALTATLFAVAALFGASVTTASPDFGALFIGPDAVAGLRNGELWTESIFAVTPGAVASTKIATNNLSVALSAWAGGALAGLGALWVVLLNGVMLGAVVAVTWHYGMGGVLGGFIAAHGPLEISLILVSAAAGLDMGRALVVAGDRPRSERMAAAGRRSLTVLIGCLPWILVLGFVEGFVSPSPLLPTSVKAAVGVLLIMGFVAMVALPGRLGRTVPVGAPSAPSAPLPTR